jgi:hypothetical protein
MARNDWRTLAALAPAAAFYCLMSQAALAQEAQSSSASTDKRSDMVEAVRELAGSVHDLKMHVESLEAQILQLQTEQQHSNAEIGELRQQLQRATAHLASFRQTPGNPVVPLPPVPAVGYSSISSAEPRPSVGSAPSSAQAATENLTAEQRLDRLDENQQFIDAKVNDLYQTKIESGSKYRIRLSGIALLNLFSNRGSVDNIDYPTFAIARDPLGSNSSFGGSLRQSQISVEGFGPDIAGARTSANLKLDFAGETPGSPNGAVMGGARLRTGTFRMDWANTSIIAGQDTLFFAPLAPTSIATLAVPALSYSGNLWGWTPQVRVEHSISFSQNSRLLFQGGILDALSGDPPSPSFQRSSSWGEESGQPAVAARVAWSQSAFGENWTLGAGGYYSRQNWGMRRDVDSWAGTIDLTLPLTTRFELSGEFYRGRAVGGLGGGIGQTVLLSGSLIDPATSVHGLDSMGGWAQLKYKPRTNFQMNAALGQDNPFAGELGLYPGVPSSYAETLARNRSWLINFIYKPRSNVVMSIEYRRLRTIELSADRNVANHVNLSLGYIF